ncbi:MAG: hypothetical protein HY706_02920 [Candidatus Hydrogenedentes bacterium]|nr:hypothetical protein [Candidatus Hydrogenedentota bacterium]
MPKKILVVSGLVGIAVVVVLLTISLREAGRPPSEVIRPDAVQSTARPSGALRRNARPRNDAARRRDGSSAIAKVSETLSASFLESLRTAWEAYRNQLAANSSTSKVISSSDVSPDNGFHYFLRAAELLPGFDFEKFRALLDKMRAEGWVDDPELRTFFEKCQVAFDALREGLAAGTAQAPLPRGPDEPMPYLANFRNLTRALAMQMEWEGLQGNYSSAFDDYVTLVQFGTDSTNGGAIINALVGYAMINIATNSMTNLASGTNASAEDYRSLITRLQAEDARFDILQNAAATELQWIDSWLEERRRAGDFDALTPDEREVLLTNPARFLGDYLALPFYEAQTVDTSDLMADPLSGTIMSGYLELPEAEARTRAQVRGTIVAAAIRLYVLDHDSLPTSLSELAPSYLPQLPEDPFTGESFRWQPVEGSYILYSSGADMEDNDGLGDTSGKTPGTDLVLARF